LAQPVQETIKIDFFSTGKKIWLTRSLELNDTQTIFYAPKNFKDGMGKIYFNDEEAYYIKTLRTGETYLPFSWEKITKERAAELVSLK